MRVVTNEDVKKYRGLVEFFIKKSVRKNWANELAHTTKDAECALGNTGMALADFRQYLYTELVVALQKYNPEYQTAKGASVKESTFVYTHLSNRIGQAMKRLTKKRFGYGIWTGNLEETIEGHKSDGE
jgi:hypothetical protein